MERKRNEYYKRELKIKSPTSQVTLIVKHRVKFIIRTSYGIYSYIGDKKSASLDGLVSFVVVTYVLTGYGVIKGSIGFNTIRNSHSGLHIFCICTDCNNQAVINWLRF